MPSRHPREDCMTVVSLVVNGKQVSREVEGRTLLVELLRDRLGLTGTHVGCDTSQCGACTVHLDGEAVKACSVFALDCEGAEVRTIEGMANPDGSLGVIQQAFQDHHGLQCGYCRSEEHTSELQSRENLVCRLLLEKKNEVNSQHDPRARVS